MNNSVFQSFWMAGFECTDKLNAFGNRVDFLSITHHLDLIDGDYRRLKPFNLTTVREGIRWSQVEKKPYEYDWSTVRMMIEKGRQHGIQQIWDLCHFGFSDDLTPLHPLFARRFAALCRSFVNMYRSIDKYSPVIVIPINEVNFLSWLGGDVRGTSPYCVGQGWEVKYGLMKGYIEGIAAMKEMDSNIKILTSEPLVNIVPLLNAGEEECNFAATLHQQQFQSIDILRGDMCPELGGKPEYIDILGFNYYYNNQWIGKTFQSLCWINRHNEPQWKNVSLLLQEAYEKYRYPFIFTETGHPGIDRPYWIEYIASECAKLLKDGLPLWGVCLYPIVDRPDWDHLTPWHKSGLWDMGAGTDENSKRILYTPMADALLQGQQLTSEASKNTDYAMAV